MNGWRVAGLLAALVGIALATRWDLLFHLVYLLAGMLLLGWLWARLGVLALEVRRELRNDRVQVGDEVVERLTVRNRTLLPLPWAALRDWSSLPGREPGRALALGPRATRTWTVRTAARRRGLYEVGPIELSAGDPFGCFAARRWMGAPERVLVLPAAEQLGGFGLPARDLPGGARTSLAGLHSSAQVFGVRDYVAGDPLNRVHWPSTARAARLVVKELEHEPAADLWIALDLYEEAHEGEGDGSTEEHAVAAAASLACHFLEAGRAVALAMQGEQHVLLQPERGERQLLRVLEALALARAFGVQPFDELLRSDAMRPDRNAALVAITPSLDPAWPDALLMATSRGARAVALLVEPSTFGGRESSIGTVSQLAAANIPTYLLKRGEPLAEALGA